MKNNYYIIAGIPAYNEEKTIAQVILLTKKYVDKVVVVDDGSIDMTSVIAESLGAEVIIHKKNKGKGAAIKDIIEYAKQEEADILILLDADGQHNPNEIPKLINPIIKNTADIVIGSRFISEKSLKKSKIPKYRKIGLSVLSSLAKKTAKLNVTDPFSGFRALSRSAYEGLTLTEDGYGTELDMLIKAKERNLKVSEVVIDISYNTGSKTSKRSPFSQSAEIIRTLIKKTVFSHPLIYFGFPGVLCLTIGFSLLIYLVNLFTSTNYFSLPISILLLMFMVIGVILTINAIIIVLINEVKQKG